MDGIGKAHSQEYGVSPAVIVEVPQVTTILGAFSEFCQGYAIMGTNSHGLRVAMSPREDSSVRIFNASSGTERKKFQLTAIRQRKEDKWGQVVKAICQNMIAAGLGIKTPPLLKRNVRAFRSERPHVCRKSVSEPGRHTSSTYPTRYKPFPR